VIVFRMLLGRVLSLVPLVLGVTLFVFIVMRFSPVDQAVVALGDTNPTDAQLDQFRRENGLDGSSGSCCTATSATASSPSSRWPTPSPPRCR
jgi:ABC-type dipeptide/oligopeptide/nickel transport system permease component